MFVGKDGRVAGSVDVAVLKALYDGTDDPELKAHYESLISTEMREEWAAGKATGALSEAPESPMADRPADYASKGDWVAYAVAQGATEEDASMATKAELIELYGGEA